MDNFLSRREGPSTLVIIKNSSVFRLFSFVFFRSSLPKQLPTDSTSKPPTEISTLAQPTTSSSNVNATVPPIKKPVVKRRHYDQPPAALLDQTDELDYGLSSDEDMNNLELGEQEEDDEEREEGDETIYLEAEEGFDPTREDEEAAGRRPQQEQEQTGGMKDVDEEEEDSDDADDTDVANLLRRS
jgi:hypothetical protein